MLNCDQENTSLFINEALKKRLLFSFNTHEQFIGNEVLPIYTFISYALMSCGLLGNGLCLMVLTKGLSLQTSHFLFYKFLSAAEMCYCLNFFLTESVESLGMLDKNQFRSYFSVFWRAYVAKFIYSSAGYMVMYTTTFISIDRSLALWIPTLYQQQTQRRRRRQVLTCCFTALIVSALFHSWAAFVDSQISATSHKNGTSYYQWEKTPQAKYEKILKAKDMYNGVIHLSYPVILLILSILVIIGFYRFQKRKQHLTDGGSRASKDRRAVDRSRERSLSLLLAIVVILAFCQVLPTEVLRVNRLICSPEYIAHCSMRLHNLTLTYEAGSDLVSTVITAQWIQIVANVLTQIDRSMKFFLYVAFNKQFRKEAGTFLKCLRPPETNSVGPFQRLIHAVNRRPYDEVSETLL